MKGVRKQRSYNPKFKLENLRKNSIDELREMNYSLYSDMLDCKGTLKYYTLSSYKTKVDRILKEKEGEIK